MNWSLIIIGFVAFALIVFLLVRNIKDEKKFENQVENDYKKPRSEEGDIEIDEKMQ